MANGTPQAIEYRCLEYHYSKLGRYSTMHIYAWQMEPPSQLSIDAWNTTTPNLAHLMADLYIYRAMHIYPWQIDTPQSNQA